MKVVVLSCSDSSVVVVVAAVEAEDEIKQITPAGTE